MSFANRLFIFVSVTAIAAYDMSAHAQTPSKPSGNGIEEIVVTARRTSERLQVTPVAVTALTPKTIERGQLATIVDLQRAAPGLSIGTGGVGPANEVMLAIRGNAQNNASSANDPAVGIYVDGVYYARYLGGNLGLLDLASAEVLRGPQGTLFGRNTTGGALNLTTVQPGGKFEGFARIGGGNFNLFMTEGAVTAPLLGDELSTRIALRYNRRDGYGENPVTGTDVANIDHDFVGRATVKWAPSTLPITFTISADYESYHDNGTPTSLAVINPTGSAAGLYSGLSSYLSNPDRFYVSYDAPHTGIPVFDNAYDLNKSGGVLGNLEVDLGEIRIKSITAWRKSRTADSKDLDGTPLDVGVFNTVLRNHQFSEELQFSGSIQNLNWIAGLYYFREAGVEASDNFIFNNVVLGPGFVVDLTAPRGSSSDYVSSSKAAFGQLNYNFTDRLRATAGFRYTWDRRSVTLHSVQNFTSSPVTIFGFSPPGFTTIQPNTCATGANIGLVNPAGGCSNHFSKGFSYPAWTVGLDYRLSDQLFTYLKTSGAALAGGFNVIPAPPGSEPFGPEKVRDIEAGFKGDFLDHKLRTNLAVFYGWRRGVQNIIVDVLPPPVGLTQYVRNTGNVRSYGAEFEGTVLPWQGMEINGNVAYLHARYAKGSFNALGVGGIVDHSGEVVQQAPKWTWGLGATQTFDFAFGQIAFHADYEYISDRSYYADTPDLTNPALTAAQREALANTYAAANQNSIINGYGTLNGRIALHFDSPDLEIALWGRNLTQKHFFTNEFSSYTGLGYILKYRGEPRTYGVTATLRW